MSAALTLQKASVPRILNASGSPIELTWQEKLHCSDLQREINHKTKMMNSLGYEIQITTLTTIMKKITEQKFFTATPSDFLPVVVGNGAWSTQLTTYRSYNIADNFETGILNVGGQNDRLATADAGVDALNIPVNYWTKAIYWSIIELEMASKSGNWDLITAKEKSRKKNYDLGIQRIAFLGARGLNGVNGQALGLLNQAGIFTDTTTITQYIWSLSPSALKTFCGSVLEVYRTNCQRTAWPTHFAVPESEMNGLASQASADFPIKSVYQVLLDMFREITGNPNFQIKGVAYADPAYHADIPSIAGKHVYTLYNYDEESLRMDLPVPYTNTLANSLNNFQFQNAAYSGFTGVLAYRPLEMVYFTW